jgi:large conductance mechanosensitive channel
MGFLGDFKAFVMRGNVLDLAVGVIIGAAFGGITKSMVDDVMMPPLGIAMGAVDFKEKYIPLTIREAASVKYEALKVTLKDAANSRVSTENVERAKTGKPSLPIVESVTPTLEQMTTAGIPTLRYGLFINTVINFVFVALGVFLIVKLMAALQKTPAPKPAVAPPPTPTEALLTEIRDTLKAQKGR